LLRAKGSARSRIKNLRESARIGFATIRYSEGVVLWHGARPPGGYGRNFFYRRGGARRRADYGRLRGALGASVAVSRETHQRLPTLEKPPTWVQTMPDANASNTTPGSVT
jgi:hypothetical protein